MKLALHFGAARVDASSSFFSASLALAFLTAGSLSAASITFPVEKEKLWLAHSQVIAFQAPPPSTKQVYPVSIEPADAAEVLMPPTQLDGEKLGFLRLRPLKAGSATLKVGDARLALEFAPNDTDRLAASPEIVSPMNNAHVWGKIAVGVELPIRTPRDWQTALSLRLPDGKEITPREIADAGVHRRATFEVDADALTPGAVRLRAVAKGPNGEKTSEPLTLVAFQPDPSLMITGACADHLETEQRPERYGAQPPKVVKDEKSPGGSYISNITPNPAWCLPVTLEDSGRYQLVMTARGDVGGGALPSIGFMVDERDRASTSVRLAGADWQRVPVGSPVYLEAGPHVITARYLNDFGYKNTDRNLMLDRYELVRVDGPKRSGDGSQMMMGGSMSMQEDDDASMMMMSQGEDKIASGTAAPAGEPVRIGFQKPFDGRAIYGPVTINARAWWQKGLRVPEVELYVNDQFVASQQGAELRYKLPVNAFRPGENTVQLKAKVSGRVMAVSTPQRLQLTVPPVLTGPAARYLRFTVQDESWDAGMAQRLDKSNTPSAAFLSNGESFLTLPEDLTGAFQVKIEGRGQDYKGQPAVEVVLRRPGQPDQIVAQANLRNGWQTIDTGSVTLEQGRKQLAIRYVNDLQEAADPATKSPGGDRNMWVKSVALEESRPGQTRPKPPTLAVRYPQAQQTIGQFDAVVVEPFSEAGIDSLDVLIDQQPQKLQIRPENGLGPVLLPLVARDLTPGRHSLQVVARDFLKQESRSPVLDVVVEDPARTANTPYQRALRLLNRFAYGPESDELIAILTLGEKNWLHQRLYEMSDSPAEQAALESALAYQPGDIDGGRVVPRVLQQLLATGNPVRARFTLWAENHFSTWIQKVRPLSKWKEHLRFAEVGPAPFSDLLMASATSPAMLVYLDQQRSFAQRLNENYAREIMELHTVGVHGGYTQADVTALAQQLNGWTVSEEADLSGDTQNLDRVFRYDPLLNNGKPRRVFGLEFPETKPEQRYDETAKVLEMLASHPSTATFISRKLAEHYVSDPAPPQLVADLSKVFLRSGGDMRAMLMAMAEHPDFWKTPARVATPIDFSLRLVRLSSGMNTGIVNDFLRRSGMGLFDRATPDGYPESDDNYTDSNALLQRWQFSKNILGNLNRFVPRSWAPAPGAPFGPAEAQRMVDITAVRLTGRPLSPTSNQAAIDYLLQAGAQDPDRVKLVTAFVTQTPELSLR